MVLCGVILGHLQFNAQIGIGTLLTFSVVLVGVTTYIVTLWRGGDPSDLREAYNTELERRREAEEDAKKLAIELAATQARTDLTGLEERMTRRMDIFEKAAEKQTKILEGLVAAVTTLVEQKA